MRCNARCGAGSVHKERSAMTDGPLSGFGIIGIAAIDRLVPDMVPAD